MLQRLLDTLRLRRHTAQREAFDSYFAAQEDPRTDAACQTLRTSSSPGERATALSHLANRELALYRLHDDALGYEPWSDDIAGDAATGLAYGAMVLRLLRDAEHARARGTSLGWTAHYVPIAWGRTDLADTERALNSALTPLLDRLQNENDPTEAAVLHVRLWIAAYPVIGGQAAEWFSTIGNGWQCRAAGVVDGPETVLVLPDAGRRSVEYLPCNETARS